MPVQKFVQPRAEDILPTLSTDLVDQLDKEYPEKVPDIEMTDRQIWEYAGARKLVRSLIRKQKMSEQYNLPQGV